MFVQTLPKDVLVPPQVFGNVRVSQKERHSNMDRAKQGEHCSRRQDPVEEVNAADATEFLSYWFETIYGS